MQQEGLILLIEDDEDDQELIRDALAQAGVPNEVKVIGNCRDAFNFLKASSAKLLIILCDVKFPNEDGLELKARINQDDDLRKRAIPFVFFSTFSNRDEVNRAFDLNGQGYFVKPGKFEELKQLLRQIYDYWSRSYHPEHE